MEKSPLEKEYRKVYQRLQDLSSKHIDNPSYKKKFEQFKIEGKAKKQDWKNGKISDAEFQEWITKQNY